MGLVIDTSAIVHLDRGKLDPNRLPFAEEALVLPAIVWAEVLIGVRLATTPERAAARRGLLERIRLSTALEPFTVEAAEHYADIYAALRKAGTPIPQNDLQVAAIALSLQFGVLVGPSDEAHFRLIPDLRVESLPS